MQVLRDFSNIVDQKLLNSIEEKAERLSGKHIVLINSTYQGGGVAEILDSAVILMNELGIKVGWRILHGTPDFFTITKKFHNGLQGEKINLSSLKKKIYYDTNKKFSLFTHIKDKDLVMVHDPQPLPLIDFYPKTQPWIFECHVDLSSPNPEVWNYLKQYICKYDHFIVSLDKYKQDLSIPQSVIYPAIDPVSPKNEYISEKIINKYMQKYDIDRNRPIISQISRFDKWKDPLGVLSVFEKVRETTDCQLVLLGSLATDDPEGQKIYEQVQAKTKKSKYVNDVKLLLIDNEFLVNCLQRASTVVIQKSIREGFGLTVSEALYKGTPVVASKVGGIPLQIIDGENGFLHEPRDYDGFANSILKILKDRALRDKLGSEGKAYVTKNFLLPRLLDDWLNLFETYLTKTSPIL
jgi:trehalose synthase